MEIIFRSVSACWKAVSTADWKHMAGIQFLNHGFKDYPLGAMPEWDRASTAGVALRIAIVSGCSFEQLNG